MDFALARGNPGANPAAVVFHARVHLRQHQVVLGVQTHRNPWFSCLRFAKSSPQPVEPNQGISMTNTNINTKTTKPAPKNAIALVKADHEAVSQLFA